ncbi:MAG: hypothetical protein P8049_09420 [Gemmatimonadota bacterium]
MFRQAHNQAIVLVRGRFMSPERTRTLSEGLVAGLLGYVSIALFFGILHLVTGQSIFRTAETLGDPLVSHRSAVIGGTAAGSVIAFNGIHLLAFLLFGLIAAWLVSRSETNPGYFLLMLFVGLAGFFYSLSGFLGFSIDRPYAPSWVAVAAANLLAGLLMSSYLLRSHPGLWSKILRGMDPETEHPFPAARSGARIE